MIKKDCIIPFLSPSNCTFYCNQNNEDYNYEPKKLMILYYFGLYIDI